MIEETEAASKEIQESMNRLAMAVKTEESEKTSEL